MSTLADDGVGSLRQSVLNSTSGDLIVFNVGGTLTLTSGEIALSNNVIIAGPGRGNLSICGGGGRRIFNVATGASATISGLTLCHGHAPNGLNGVRINDWTITPGEPGQPGGAIISAGELALVDCRLSGNSAGIGGNGTVYGTGYPGGSGGGPGGDGGAIFSTGLLSVTNCVIENNMAGAGGISGANLFGPTGGAGGSGGGIYSAATIQLKDCVVRANSSGAGGSTSLEAPGAGGGNGAGVASAGNLIASGCTFYNNVADTGGPGGNDSEDAGTGGNGGAGGGLYLAAISSLTNCTITRNTAGSGGRGGDSWMGAPGTGGAGGNGGGVLGTDTLSLINCTICNNSPGAGGLGGYRPPSPYFPFPSYGATGQSGSSGGVAMSEGGTAQLLNSLSAGNQGSHPDVSGPVSSLGHNLIGVTNSSLAFTNAGDLGGSLTSPLDAKLDALANNGGPTPTIALLPGSPAWDAGASAGAPSVDQRGLPRPRGSGVDVGALENQFDLPWIRSIALASNSTCILKIWGTPNQSCCIEQSTNLVDWEPITTQPTDASGILQHTNAPNRACNFYRVRTAPN